MKARFNGHVSCSFCNKHERQMYGLKLISFLPNTSIQVNSYNSWEAENKKLRFNGQTLI